MRKSIENRKAVKLMPLVVTILFCLCVAQLKAQISPPPQGGDTITTALTTVTNAGGIVAWSNGNKIMIDFNGSSPEETTIRIYLLTGQLLLEEKYSGNGIYTRIINNPEAGFVVLSISTETGLIARKLFIQNR